MKRKYVVGRTICKIEGCGKEKVKHKHSCQPLCREHFNEYHRKYRQDNLERVREIHRISRNKLICDAKQKARDEANKAVRFAVLRKKIKKLPCEVCGDTKAQAHHASYKPEDRLTVNWLCVIHHAEEHRNSEPIYGL